MSYQDLIDAYLENEMTAAEKLSFEQQLGADPSLSKEFEFQKEVFEGIKEARRQELKSFLNSVPVGGGLTIAGGMSLTKLAAIAILITGIGFSIYYFTNKDEESQPELVESTSSEPSEAPTNQEDNSSAVEQLESQEKSDDINENAEDKSVTSSTVESEEIRRRDEVDENTSTEDVQVAEQKQPVAPNGLGGFENENTQESEDPGAMPGEVVSEKNTFSQATILTETDNTNKKYTFHYQFKKDKLVLYGDFSKSIYELLEFNSGTDKTLYLYYRDQFYSLNQTQVKITPLQAIKDKSLVQQLMKIKDIED
ncbi:MAG: hypothetical protein AAFX87_11625 [Bacteroidota bacterium]